MSKITKSIFIFLTFFLGFFAYQSVNAEVANWVQLTNLSVVNDLYGSNVSAVDITNSELVNKKICDINQNNTTKTASIWTGYFNDPNATMYLPVISGNNCNWNGTDYYWWSSTEPILFLGNNYQFLSTNSLTALPDGEYHYRYFSDLNTSYYFNFTISSGYGTITEPITEPESGIISILVNRKSPEFNTETPVTIKIIFNNLEEDNYKFIKYLIEDNNDPTKYLMGEKETSKIGLLKDESFTSNFFEENKTYTGSFFLSKFSGNSSFPGDTDTVNFTITTKDIVSINGIFSSLPDYEDFECEIGLTSMTGENLMNCGKRMIAWVFLPDYGTKEKVQKMILENEDTILYLPWTLLNNFTDTSDTLGEATVTLPFVGETEIVGDNFQIPYNWDNLGKILLWSIFVSMWGWFFIRKLFF